MEFFTKSISGQSKHIFVYVLYILLIRLTVALQNRYTSDVTVGIMTRHNPYPVLVQLKIQSALDNTTLSHTKLKVIKLH